MEPLEFYFLRERRRGFLDLDIPEYSRLPRPRTKIQMLKREVRGLEPGSREKFASRFLWYDAASWEPQLRREKRAGTLHHKGSNGQGDLR